ncbi:MAG: hypothetical protein P8X55_15300, partial [Desulfosarcinaceae bacterium]
AFQDSANPMHADHQKLQSAFPLKQAFLPLSNFFLKTLLHGPIIDTRQGTKRQERAVVVQMLLIIKTNDFRPLAAVIAKDGPRMPASMVR